MRITRLTVPSPAAILVLAATLAIPGCRKSTADANTIHLNGRIEAAQVDLGPKVAGRVSEVRVREGDRVKAGDLLVRLDLGDTAVAVEREQAGVRSAEARAKDVKAGSFAEDVGLSRGDIILEVNRQAVDNEEQFNRVVATLKSGQDVVFLVRQRGAGRQGGTIFLAGTLP